MKRAQRKLASAREARQRARAAGADLPRFGASITALGEMRRATIAGNLASLTEVRS